MIHKKLVKLSVALFAVSAMQTGLAEEVKKDGQWRGLASVGFSNSSGNTKSTSINLAVDAARLTEKDQWTIFGQALNARAELSDSSDSETTAELWRLGARYDRNITSKVFAFGGLEFEGDKLKDLKLRSAVNAGLGYHVIDSGDLKFDVFGGLGARRDKYDDPGVLIDSILRTKYSATEALIGEEFSAKLTDSVSFKERLVVYPNLKDSGEFRAVFDAGLSVAMSKIINLTVSLQHRHDSLAEDPLKKGDTLIMTGLGISLGAK